MNSLTVALESFWSHLYVSQTVLPMPAFLRQHLTHRSGFWLPPSFWCLLSSPTTCWPLFSSNWICTSALPSYISIKSRKISEVLARGLLWRQPQTHSVSVQRAIWASHVRNEMVNTIRSDPVLLSDRIRLSDGETLWGMFAYGENREGAYL